jgi:hypothetical protein
MCNKYLLVVLRRALIEVVDKMAGLGLKKEVFLCNFFEL